jgi:uncharacterized DUF497 family protein
MNISFDPSKDASNLAKHGVSLAQAAELEWEDTLIWADVRKSYGEARMCGIGYIGLHLFFVAFVDRAEGRRIISLRKANLKEVERYAKA